MHYDKFLGDEHLIDVGLNGTGLTSANTSAIIKRKTTRIIVETNSRVLVIFIFLFLCNK
jgi:hypothetical protein